MLLAANQATRVLGSSLSHSAYHLLAANISQQPTTPSLQSKPSFPCPLPPQYNTTASSSSLKSMDDGTDGVPSHGDWENARRTIHFLENFYALTVKASGSLYVTSTISWCILLLYLTLGLDLNMLKESFAHYMRRRGLIVAKDVKIALFEMFDDYRRLNTPQKGAQSNENAQFQTTITNETIENENFREAEIRKRKERMKRCRSEFEGGDAKTELDKYICEDGDEDSEDFDILSWWKVNSPRFSVLSQMARDALAVPISTVASESAFSTGGRVLDPFRSCLSPKIVQALLCTQDWLKDSPFDIVDIQETMEYIDKLENEFTTLAPVNI